MNNILMFLPLALASAVSLPCFLLIMKFFTSKEHARRRGLLFIAGAALAHAVVIIAAICFFRHLMPVKPHQPHYFERAIVDFILAGVAAAILLKILFRKKISADEANENAGVAAGNCLHAFFSGFFIKITEAGSLTPLIGAVHLIHSDGYRFADNITLYLTAWLLSISVLLFTGVMFVWREQATLRIIEPIGRWIEIYKYPVIKIVLVLVILILFIHGIGNIHEIHSY